MACMANTMQARISSFSRKGYASKIASMVSPAAKYSRIALTVIRIPLIVGFPLQMAGFAVIRFNRFSMIFLLFCRFHGVSRFSGILFFPKAFPCEMQEKKLASGGIQKGGQRRRESAGSYLFLEGHWGNQCVFSRWKVAPFCGTGRQTVAKTSSGPIPPSFWISVTTKIAEKVIKKMHGNGMFYDWKQPHPCGEGWGLPFLGNSILKPEL